MGNVSVSWQPLKAPEPGRASCGTITAGHPLLKIVVGCFYLVGAGWNDTGNILEKRITPPI